MTDFERRVHFSPAYDKRSADPSKNYGIGGMRAWFYVIGPKGAVQWQAGFPFYVQSVRTEARAWPASIQPKLRPEGWDLGYHAREPHYEGQDLMSDCCEILKGPCYYDGSSLNAELLVEEFVEGGTDWLWPKLEDYYRFLFEEGEWPFEAEAARAKAEGRYL